MSQIKDSQFRETKSNVHPFFEPYIMFNDHKDSVDTVYVSCYNDTEYCRKTFGGFAPYDMHKINPHLYHWPEKKENEKILLKKGESKRIPHTFYRVYTRDDKPAVLNHRSMQQL